MKRKIILPIFVVILLIGGVVYYKAVTRPEPLVLTGIVTTNDVEASSQIQGQLAQVLVKEGDTVKPGQLIAVIEPQEMRADASYYLHAESGTASQVTEAEAALKFQETQTSEQIKQAEASLAAAQAQEVEAKADLELDRLNYDRTKGLYAQKIDSQEALDKDRATYEAQQAHVDSLGKQVDVQRQAVALARSNVDQNAVRDITERKRAEAEHVRLVTAIEQSAEAVVITNTNGDIEYVNPAFTRITGYSREEVLGQNPRILKSGKQDLAFYQQLWETILKGRPGMANSSTGERTEAFTPRR